MIPQNTAHMRISNSQNLSGHVELPQGIPSHGPSSQGLTNHPVQPQVLQTGPPHQMPTHQASISQTGPQTQCPPGAVPSTSAHITPVQIGLPSSVQQQISTTPSSSGNFPQQSASNTSIPPQGSGSSNNISVQSSKHIPNLKGPGIHGLQGTQQASASTHPMHFQSPMQSQATEPQQLKQESKPDTAELISFD